MGISQETEDYIRETIDDTLGLQVSTQTLQMKLRASEEDRIRLRSQYFHLHSKLKEKDQTIDRTKAEATMNAQAVKKFVEENQKLAMECSNLLAQCKKWERECSLYDNDREALMDFGNEADQRAKDAEIRVLELEEEVKTLSEELQFYKNESQKASTSTGDTVTEQLLLESLLKSAIGKEEVATRAHLFLEANKEVEVCKRLLNMWSSLNPSTQKVLALISEVMNLEKDKEHLKVNLHKAEDEVNVLFEANSVLDEENKRLLRQLRREKHPPPQGSGGKHSGSDSTKSNKRKSNSKLGSPAEKKIDFTDVDSVRQPLSPLASHQYPPDTECTS